MPADFVWRKPEITQNTGRRGGEYTTGRQGK